MNGVTSGPLQALVEQRLRAGVPLVVRMRVSRPPVSAQAAELLLPPSDLHRIHRLRREEDRSRSRLALVIVRMAIGAWRGVSPDLLHIERSPSGKPSIAGAPAFSITHADDCVAVAFAATGHIGVDVEPVRDDLDLDSIAERCWHVSEYDTWRRVSPEKRPAWFARHWTAKESIVKALGLGVDSMAVIACDSWTTTGSKHRVLELGGYADPSSWSLLLAADGDFRMAVATDQRSHDIEIIAL